MNDIQNLCAIIRDRLKQIDQTTSATFTKHEWDKILACIDTMEDAQEAIDFYKAAPAPTCFGANYLSLYGLFQAFILQQDAVETLCNILGFSYGNLFPDIRSCRNDIVGHPTNRKNGKNVVRLIRNHLRHDSAEYVVYSAEDVETKRIDISGFINLQEEQIISLLRAINNKLLKLSQS